MTLILASASPRRRELLHLLTTEFECIPSDIDETPMPGELPEDYVVRMAVEKAQAQIDADRLILAADTTVTIDGAIFGKPSDKHEAKVMLQRLSGREHSVHSAVAVRQGDVVRRCLVSTRVTFGCLTDRLISQYLATSEPWDKAGAYAIQGFAGCFVNRLEGSYTGVVGLPLLETRVLLESFGSEINWSQR